MMLLPPAALIRPMLLEKVKRGELDPTKIITHQ